MNRSRASLLYLQMGQEVIYILLACAIVTSLLLLSIAVRNEKRLTALKQERDELSIRLDELEKEKLNPEAQLTKYKALLMEYAEKIDKLNAVIKVLSAKNSELRNENDRLSKEAVDLKNSAYNNDQPPIILLTESEGYTFETGSAKVSPNFRENVKNKILPSLMRNAERYSAHVIEIIGHTDEVPFGTTKRGPSDLDTTLFKALNGITSAGALIPHDNIGLGMARAISVRQLLVELGLHDFTVLPLSAGPAITPNEAIAYGYSPHTGIVARRRIEIRLRRKSKRDAYEQPK
jgi:flagellar motor protein MotB